MPKEEKRGGKRSCDPSHWFETPWPMLRRVSVVTFSGCRVPPGSRFWVVYPEAPACPPARPAAHNDRVSPVPRVTFRARPRVSIYASVVHTYTPGARGEAVCSGAVWIEAGQATSHPSRYARLGGRGSRASLLAG